MNAPCEDFRMLFEPFLDGGLSKRERIRVKKHLKACPACRSELDREREVVDLLSALPEAKCPENVVRKIEEETFGREKKKSYIKRWVFGGQRFRWGTLSVGVAVVAVIILLVVQPLGDRSQPDRVQYSQEEVQKAKDEAKWSLAYLAKVVGETERNVVEDVLLKDVPSTLRKSIRKTIPIFGGDEQ